ncbi:hypothetical protein [Phenylobacterium sp. SCN 70-31]|mgnify:CR=1 FL=1|uniref:hypothetical protein n=1 Tax=Phenylobacterium sp. SCN 70-31 TaxID=1660129 RepID=UPI00086C8E97|nr:hypothetical protein [Phenylobacterium sp. SCN 70-31]ODT86486.1 MAG: hypothetical protein ABS78_16175 [Phenylobacterium sp. SCN 70-31]
MRVALSSLIVAAGLATAAQAQDPAEQPAAPPAVEPAPAATPEPAPAPEPPPLPTSGYGFEAIQVVEQICRPAVRGQSLEDLAKSHGFKLNRREQTWAKPFGGEGRNYQVILYPSGSNKSVCMADFRFPIGKEEEIAKAFNVWAFVQQPPLDPTANYTQPQDPDGLKRVRRSWEYLTTNQSIGLNFSTVRNPDDSQVNKNYDLATMQYQERSF